MMLKLIMTLPLLLALAQPALAAEEEKTQNNTASSSTATDVAYTIRPGDLLHINVWKEEEMDREVSVLPDGTVDFPLVGSFKAAGLTSSEVQQLIKTKLTNVIPGAAVTVEVKETRGNAVSVIGQVTKPGDIIMNRNITVMQALSQAGGLTTYADEDDIVILRKVDGKETSIPFDYSDVANGRDLETNITLNPGDVVVVPTASLF